MESLSASRLRKVVHMTAQVAELRDLSEFRAGVVTLLHELVPCESASYNEVKPGASAIVLADPAIPPTSESVEIFGRFSHENPLIDHYMRTGDGQPLRFSDFISQRALHRLALYEHVYRQLGVEHQIAFVLPSPPGEVVGLALNRERRDFTDAEAAMLNLLRRPLRAYYERLSERERLTSLLSAYEADSLTGHTTALALSEREAQVMQVVSSGASNAEVATSLGISRRTVEKHLQHIYMVLDVTSRTQAIARMQAAGAPARSRAPAGSACAPSHRRSP
jgi:DNA-binding CsgD family transcriptional regulator